MNVNLRNIHYSNSINSQKENKCANIPFRGGFDFDEFSKKTLEVGLGEELYQSVKKSGIGKKIVDGVVDGVRHLLGKGSQEEKVVKGKVHKPKKKDIEKGAQKITDMIMGSQNSEDLAKGAKDAAARARGISQKRMQFPELLAGREDRHAILAKNKVKESSGQLDLEYYKDDFRAFVTVPVERLNNLRKSNNPELRAMFDLDKNNFMINEGIMIHGSNRTDKKQLLEHFITEAKKYEMDVVRIQAGDSDPVVFSQQIPKLFSEAKERFLKDKKATMFVMEDMDKMLNFKDPQLSAQNSWVRGAMNEHTHKCGNDGVIWVSTVDDLSQLDESCYRGGRVRHTIDIDKTKKFNK